LYGHIHTGGWSNEPANGTIIRLNKNFIWVVITMVVFCGSLNKCRHQLLQNIQKFLPLILLLLLTWAAMTYHSLQSLMAWGEIATRTSYSMAVFPVFCMLLVAFGVFKPRITISIGLLYVILFSMAYYSGIYNLLVFSSGQNNLVDAIELVISHHSVIMKSYPVMPGLVIELILLTVLTMLVAKNLFPEKKRVRHPEGDFSLPAG
jgi:hypothetical protein